MDASGFNAYPDFVGCRARNVKTLGLHRAGQDVNNLVVKRRVPHRREIVQSSQGTLSHTFRQRSQVTFPYLL